MDTLPTATVSLYTSSIPFDAISTATSNDGFYPDTSQPQTPLFYSPDRILLIIGCVLGTLTVLFLLLALYFVLKLRRKKQTEKYANDTQSMEEERMLSENFLHTANGHKTVSLLSDPNSAFSIAVKRAAEIPDSPIEKKNLY